MKTETLPVPGATLHHEVRGTGPLVLLICGGIYDAAGYTELAERLAVEYTVVTYDRRGNSRSPLDGPPARQAVAEHAEDAHRLIAALGGPAFVFGNSSGAQIGLELAVRHPGDVRVLAAHEPPLFDLLPDAGHWRAVVAEVEAAFAAGGVERAMGVFAAAMGMAGDGPEPPDDPEAAAVVARFAANSAFFVGHEAPGFGAHETTLPSTPVIPLVGAGSAGQPPHRATRALAARLGTEVTTVPGDHGGFGTHAAAFATVLTDLFQEQPR